jgi:hypothetical protein
MKRILGYVHGKARSLAAGRLFTHWLDDPAVPPAEKFCFTPAALDFIMGFRDLNRYFIRYENPTDDLQRALNEHAAEDATHSALLLQDWPFLGIDRILGWAPRDLYWWMTSEATVESRRIDFELTSLVYHNQDPRLRFAIIESMEAAGHVFFEHTIRTADVLERTGGGTLLYYGRHHLDRETGHLLGPGEKLFGALTLSPEMCDRARALVDRVFDVFAFHFDTWERFAQSVRSARFDHVPRDAARASARLRTPPVRDVSVCMELEHPEGATGVNRELARERARGFERLWDMPFYRWIRTAWPGRFKRMVRFFFLQWTVDNWACADYFLFDTRYPKPRTALERGINRLSVLYASEMNRRYFEWERLQLDEFTGWGTAEALAHYWLDEGVEEHRAIFADLRKLTFDYPEPLHRYWIMKCFVRYGDALMRSLGHAMRLGGEPEESFVGFAGAPERMHPILEPDERADAAVADIERQPVSAADAVILRDIMRRTFEQEARRARASWRVVREERFGAMDRRWAARTRTSDGSEAASSSSAKRPSARVAQG